MALKSIKIGNAGPFRSLPEDGSSEEEDNAKFGMPPVNFEAHQPAGDIISTADLVAVEIIFDEYVNLFIGPNNSGKSTVLRALRILTNAFEHIPNALSDWDHYFQSCYLSTEWSEGRIVLQWVGNKMSAEFEGTEPRNAPDNWNSFVQQHGYIAFHNIEFPYEQSDGTDPYAVIKGLNEDLYNEVQDHISDTYGWETPVLMAICDKSDGPGFDQSNAFDEVVSIISDITQGYSIDLRTNLTFQTHGGPEGLARWQYVANTMDGGVRTTDFSQGTRSIVYWAFRIMFCMALYYDCKPGWKDMPGIFVIDEIDAHLHPSWQRRIIPTLRRHFPNVQIFASTHSPMMVAGLEKGQVHLLKRDETGRVVWSRNEQDIIGWTADEIYRTFMGIEDPTDELTVQRANRLRELRDQRPRTEAEEDEMNALRRQVNEDLLAKGRINAQRERYAGLMERFLRSRMTDLSQDGA